MSVNLRNSVYQPLVSNCAFPAHAYSLMKHGCVESRRYFSQMLAQFINERVDPERAYLVTASAYRTLPNAANQLLDDVLSQNPLQPFRRTALRRRKLVPVDFAGLSQTERLGLVESLTFDCDLEDLKDQPLIVVDDVYVTGAHERAIISQLSAITSELHFFYLVDLSGSQYAAIENELNQKAVKSILDVLPLRNNPEYQYNSRVLKMLYLSSEDDFSTFLSTIPQAEVAFLYEMAIKEGFEQLGDHYRMRHHYIQAAFLSREGLVDERSTLAAV